MSEDYEADEGPSLPLPGLRAKKEEVEDFTFDEPCLKKQKTTGSSSGHPTALPPSEAHALRNELNMNWDLIEVMCLCGLLLCCMCSKLFVLCVLNKTTNS